MPGGGCAGAPEYERLRRMGSDVRQSAGLEFIRRVNDYYAELFAHARSEEGEEPNLGGQLLYAGELNAESGDLVRAANIAGAASLCCCADPAAQRQAMREGVVDFVVTNLDEALRILKNEVRKRNGVAVCVGAPGAQVQAEMVERGVVPDLLPPPAAEGEMAAFVRQGARAIELSPAPPGRTFVVVPNPPADFESRALALISDLAARRWLRLSPKYLGPGARRVRSVACEAAIARELTGD